MQGNKIYKEIKEMAMNFVVRKGIRGILRYYSIFQANSIQKMSKIPLSCKMENPIKILRDDQQLGNLLRMRQTSIETWRFPNNKIDHLWPKNIYIYYKLSATNL